MKNKRFHGKIGKRFSISAIAIPHYKTLQNTIGKTIREYFRDKPIDKINVLEIGCGTGYTTLSVLESDKRTMVTALDNEPIMIKQAQINLKDFVHNNRVKLFEEDALEFLKKQATRSFDVFVSALTLHNFTNDRREKVIKEVYRVLKKRGVFVNADKYAFDDKAKHKKSLEWQLQQFKDQFRKIGCSDLVDEWVNHYLEDNKPDMIIRESESIKSMIKIGFKNPKIIFRKEMEAILFAEKY